MFTQKGALVNLKNGAQLLLTLNEHNCFLTVFKATEGSLYFLSVYFVKIKNEHRNIHFNYFFSSDFSDNVMRTFYKLAVTMRDNVILLHD